MGPALFKFPAANYLQVFTAFLAKVLYQRRQLYELNEGTVSSDVLKYYSI